MSLDYRLTIVVAAAAVGAARDVAEQLDPGHGKYVFGPGLNALAGAADAVPTHYWCSWALDKATHDALRSKLQTLVDSGLATIYDGTVQKPDSVLSAKTLQPFGTATSVTAGVK